jgi:Ribosomal RNA adenine dimethylase
MNLLHRLACRSALWRWTVERWVIPWALDGLDPGEDVPELGPGPGLTADVLRERTARLTAVELNPRLALSLQERMKGTNVEVVEAAATAIATTPSPNAIRTNVPRNSAESSPQIADRHPLLLGDVCAATVVRPFYTGRKVTRLKDSATSRRAASEPPSG